MNRLFQHKSIHAPSPIGMALSYLVLGIWTVIVLLPLYWLVVTSLKIPIQVHEGPFYIPFVDFQPSLHAWDYVLLGDLSRDTLRTYINTVIVAPISALLALLLGTAAAYALVRFDYRPRLGAIVSFIGCVVLMIVAVILGVPWQIAVVAGLAVFIIILITIGRRFKRALGNDDIAFWMI
jgi:multiple sugar transport system permease protein